MKISAYVAAILCGMAAFSTAHGIGRSGNGTIQSQVLGFTASAPEQFEISRGLSGERLRLLSPVPLAGPLGLQPLYLEFSSSEFSLPQMSGLQREELRGEMKNRGWETMAHQDPCVEAFFYPQGMAVAAFWGPGKGMVAVGPPSSQVREAEVQVMDSLRLDRGACAW